MTALLNAQCLKECMLDSRKSDRDFVSWLFKAIPFPAFDKQDNDHLALVALCLKAERMLSRTEIMLERRNINEVDGILQESGVLSDINTVVRELLPKHSA